MTCSYFSAGVRSKKLQNIFLTSFAKYFSHFIFTALTQIFLRILGSRDPRRPENVDRFGEDVIVHHSRVNGKDAHEQDDVPTSEKDVPNFVVAMYELRASTHQLGT